jgi:hypothetical protein
LLFFVLLFAIPQSPRRLAIKGRMAESLESLRRLGISNPAVVAASYADQLPASGTSAALSWARHRKPILLAAPES